MKYKVPIDYKFQKHFCKFLRKRKFVVREYSWFDIGPNPRIQIKIIHINQIFFYTNYISIWVSQRICMEESYKLKERIASYFSIPTESIVIQYN